MIFDFARSATSTITRNAYRRARRRLHWVVVVGVVGADENLALRVYPDVWVAGARVARNERHGLDVFRIVYIGDDDPIQGRWTRIAVQVGNPVVDARGVEA